MIDGLLSLAKDLLAIKETFTKAKKEQRESMAKYFEDISTCIAEAATSLRSGVTPHGKCGEMDEYAHLFTKKVENVIDKKEAEGYAKRIKKSTKVEDALYELNLAKADAQRIEKELAKMERTAGQFKALANSIRAG